MKISLEHEQIGLSISRMSSKNLLFLNLLQFRSHLSSANEKCLRYAAKPCLQTAIFFLKTKAW